MNSAFVANTSGDVFQNLGSVVLKMLKPEEVKYWRANSDRLCSAIAKGFSLKIQRRIPKMVEEWENFYRKNMGLHADFSKVKIPRRRSGFEQLIIVSKGLTPNIVYKTSAEYFPCVKNDISPTIDDHRPNPPYAIWVREYQNNGGEYAGISVDQTWRQKIKGITLLERLLLGFKYHSKMRIHLDDDCCVECSGSRFPNGTVPKVRHESDLFEVCMHDPKSNYMHIGIREVHY